MAKIKYNIKLWADTAVNLAADTTVYKENDFIFATGSGVGSGVLKKGDGEKTYKELGSIGTVATWKDIEGKPTEFKPSAHDHAVANISDWPESFPPAAHDHAVAVNEETGLEAAETLQGLAEALSARIAELEVRVSLLEVADEGGDGGEGGDDGEVE